VAVTPNGFKIVSNAFSIALVQLGVVAVLVALAAPVVLLVELLPGLLVALLLTGTLAALLVLGVLLVVVPVVVPAVVPVVLAVVPVVVPAVVPVVLAVVPVLVLHPAYVADAPKSLRMLETRASILEQEFVLLLVEVVPLLLVLPEPPDVLHVVWALAGNEKLANIIKASMTGVTRMIFWNSFVYIQISPLLFPESRLIAPLIDCVSTKG
jgi:hypothetical protein